MANEDYTLDEIREMSETLYNLRLYYHWCIENLDISVDCLGKLYDVRTTLTCGNTVRLAPERILELFRGLLTLIFEDSTEGFAKAQDELSGLPGYLEVHF